MALRWEWSGKVGYLQQLHEDGTKTEYTLYEGNACLIGLIEKEDTYSLGFFFADLLHMKRCLGIDSAYDSDNMFEHTGKEIVHLVLYRNKMQKQNFQNIVRCFSMAFNHLMLTISNDAE